MMHKSTGKLLANNIDHKVKTNDLKGAAALYVTYQHLLSEHITEANRKAIESFLGVDR